MNEITFTTPSGYSVKFPPTKEGFIGGAISLGIGLTLEKMLKAPEPRSYKKRKRIMLKRSF